MAVTSSSASKTRGGAPGAVHKGRQARELTRDSNEEGTAQAYALMPAGMG